ncbi:hypothetical protein RERY_13670 [Rhodococcus erythropolis]|jgi:hypothetical protein|nr:hypothetical protein [Rhodococcus erythropolis]OFV77921.1 hypothetical protein RERY_13670 [Rhodococcus erythropolis]
MSDRFPAFTRRNHRAATALALAFSMGSCIAGCAAPNSTENVSATTTPAASNVYVLPSYMTDYHNQWLADPGIDLFSEEATIIRAFIESDYIVDSGGDRSDAYHGFSRITANTRGTVSSDRRYGEPADTPPRVYRGTSINRILSIQTIPAGYPGDSTVVAYACSDAYDTDYDGRKPDSSRLPSSSYEIWMHNTASTATPNPRFEGPRNAPEGDVFGGWIVDKFTSSTSDRVQQETCSDWFKSRHDGSRLRMSTDFAPPLVLPNYPGWPEDAAR